MTLSDWSSLFFARLGEKTKGFAAPSGPDEDGHYATKLNGKDLFVMGCDDCFATVWFEGSPVCDYSNASATDAKEAALFIASAAA
ncbi:MAG TPA: hypothetical protein VKT51_11935 [Candidatus Eremiobacteraceae bacterium]|nr:hypothetical protein [Candidatus Eremiobacteraceae bacterium]